MRNIHAKISPDPSLPKRGIPPFRKGRRDRFAPQRPYDYEVISKTIEKICDSGCNVVKEAINLA